jgi:hypothetical protein
MESRDPSEQREMQKATDMPILDFPFEILFGPCSPLSSCHSEPFDVDEASSAAAELPALDAAHFDLHMPSKRTAILPPAAKFNLDSSTTMATSSSSSKSTSSHDMDASSSLAVSAAARASTDVTGATQGRKREHDDVLEPVQPMRPQLREPSLPPFSSSMMGGTDPDPLLSSTSCAGKLAPTAGIHAPFCAASHEPTAPPKPAGKRAKTKEYISLSDKPALELLWEKIRSTADEARAA